MGRSLTIDLLDNLIIRIDITSCTCALLMLRVFIIFNMTSSLKKMKMKMPGEFAKYHTSRAFSPSVSSRLCALRMFVPSYLTCLYALRAFIRSLIYVSCMSYLCVLKSLSNGFVIQQKLSIFQGLNMGQKSAVKLFKQINFWSIFKM